MNIIQPVSYTHLDVYKRQVVDCPLQNEGNRAAAENSDKLPKMSSEELVQRGGPAEAKCVSLKKKKKSVIAWSVVST